MPAVQPLIAIKAGKCTQDGTTIIPSPEPGLLYVYLHPEEELHHFCWKPRGAVEPEDDLLIIPGDARLLRHNTGPTGRIFVLKFSSSSQRNFYWLQAQSQGPNKEPGFWSQGDMDWIKRIDRILQSEEGEDDGEDEEMGDPPIQSGDIEHEGEQPRRGGGDGGRAPPQFDLASLLSQIQVPGHAQGGLMGQHAPTMSLHDLLSPANTVRSLDTVSQTTIDNLIANLPPAIVPKDATADEKKAVIAKVLRSPQFAQSSIGLSAALREGGLMGVADSLRVPIESGGATRLDQVELFIKGVKKEVEKESGSEM